MNASRMSAMIAVVVCAGAAWGATVSVVGPQSATPGGTVTVSVALSPDLNAVYALQAGLTYDPVVLTPLPTQETAAAQGFWSGSQAPFPGETIPRDADLFRMNYSQSGVIIFGYVKNPANPAGSGTVVVPPTALRITFNVASGATGHTALQLAPYAVNGKSMPALILGASDGSPVDAAIGAPMNLALALPGDANGDGAVKLDDVIAVLRLAGGVAPNGVRQAQIADVWPAGARDNKVTLQDAARLLRFIEGLESGLN